MRFVISAQQGFMLLWANSKTLLAGTLPGFHRWFVNSVSEKYLEQDSDSSDNDKESSDKDDHAEADNITMHET